jgi:hypothetical protein
MVNEISEFFGYVFQQMMSRIAKSQYKKKPVADRLFSLTALSFNGHKLHLPQAIQIFLVQ